MVVKEVCYRIVCVAHKIYVLKKIFFLMQGKEPGEVYIKQLKY